MIRPFAAALLIASLPAFAQQFPTKPVRLIVGFPPGGPTDTIARAIAPKTSELLGQPFVVENNGGAAGLVASQTVARATPDGYTLLLAVTGAHLMRPMLEKNVPFDPIKDFTAITQLNESVFAIASNPQTGPKTLEELIDIARKNPGKLSYGTAGLGSETHLLMEKLGKDVGGRLQVVPYKGAAPAVVDLLAGTIPLVMQPVIAFMPHVKSGKLKVLGVFLDRRWDQLPDVPAIREVVPGFEKSPGGAGIFGPAGIPAAVATRLQQAMTTALHEPATNEKLAAGGQIAVGSSPEQFSKDLLRARVIFAELVKAANLKIE
jgi:tripartite-type tricarboxylate transporter receptor subunit TctC